MSSFPLDNSTFLPLSPKRDTPASPDEEFASLLELLQKNLEGQDLTIVRKAFEFASRYHKDQTRKSGEPYIIHPIAVAAIAAALRLDLASVVAALLHDVVEDTACSSEDIEKDFGTEIASLVEGLTKISKIKFSSSQERLAENFRKMILAMAKDLRVILVKLCDRLHNMRTIGSLSEEKRKRIAQETIDIYAPLASRLGLYSLKSELEDLCLRHLKHDVYQEIRSKVSAKKSERQGILELELRKYGFKDCLVYGRPKHFFSIYKKIVERHVDFEDIHDLFAFRIVVGTIKDCYEALGVIHAMWKPMPGRFKDYIAMPKANMYQSLHTTVIRPNGEPAEIQIRTREMHEISEFGVAAHWAYKERKSKNMDTPDLEKFSWLRQIIQWQNELKDPDEFLEAVKVDLFDEEIFVFTPKGDVISLPQKATPLDFAFAVHTNIGLKTTGAKVNSRIVPLKRPLESGDIVEILTSPHQHPTKDWLNYITTTRARNKIRSYLRSEQREKSRNLGRTLIEQELGRRNVSVELLDKPAEMEKLYRAGREGSWEDLLVAIGYSKIDARDVIDRAYPQTPKVEGVAEQLATTGLSQRLPKPTSKSSSGVLVSGHDGVLVNFGLCCNPLPGETIIGFITRGRGVTVHRSSCQRALDSDPQRRIDVTWRLDQSPDALHRCYIRIVTQERPGVLADVTGAISSCGANVQKAEVKVSQDMTGCLDFELGVKDLGQLDHVTSRLESITAVISVERRNGPKAHKKSKKKK